MTTIDLSDIIQYDVSCRTFNVKLNKDLLKNVDIAKLVLKQNFMFMAYMPDNIKDSEELVLETMKTNTTVYRFASERVKGLKSITDELFKGTYIPSYIPESILTDLDYMWEKIKQNPKIIKCLKRLWCDRDFMLAVVQLDGSALQYASCKLRDDKEVVLAAINTSDVMEYVSLKLRNNMEVIKCAISHDPTSYVYASDELKEDYNLAKFAIGHSYNNMFHVADELRDNEELAKFAISINGSAIRYVTPRLRDNKTLVMAAIKNSKYSNYHNLNELSYDIDVAFGYLEIDQRVINEIPSTLKHSEEFRSKLMKYPLTYCYNSYKNMLGEKFNSLFDVKLKTDENGVHYKICDEGIKPEPDSILYFDNYNSCRIYTKN